MSGKKQNKLSRLDRTDAQPAAYQNDFMATVNYIRKYGGEYHGIPNAAEIAALNAIAADCMRAYQHNEQDRELVGWVLFGEIHAEEPVAGSDNNGDVDGICYIGTDGRAAIGISRKVLNMPIYAAVAVGLHELAHLCSDNHDDRFVSRLMQLQYNYYLQEGEKKK